MLEKVLTKNKYKKFEVADVIYTIYENDRVHKPTLEFCYIPLGKYLECNLNTWNEVKLKLYHRYYTESSIYYYADGRKLLNAHSILLYA